MIISKLSLSGLLLSATLAIPAFAELQTVFDEQGLASMKYGTNVFMQKDTRMPAVEYIHLTDGLKEKGFEQVYAPKPTARTFDIEKRQLSLTFTWGDVVIDYRPGSNRLDVTVSITNRSERPIQNCPIDLFALQLPHVRQNTSPAGKPQLGVQMLRIESGVLGAEGLNVSLRGAPGTPRKIVLSGPYPSRSAFHPVVDDSCFEAPGDIILPGETRSWTGILVVGPEGATRTDLFPNLISDIAKAKPMVLDWSDRRPIATVFLCNPATGLKTNPRGWFQGNKKVDITTEEGLVAFGERLMKYADNCIRQMKDMNAQGVIVWDIEGQEFHHAISYVGDPRVLPEAAPEMDRFADAFMKKFADAGFDTGITIRPTEFYRSGDDGTGPWLQREVPNPVATMAEKIRYAHERWGTKIFYLDSNVFGKSWIKGMEKPRNVPWTMPVKMIEQLQEQFPQCLIIPEWSSRDYYRFSAPYSSVNLRQRGTDDTTRAIWPEAFRIVSVNRGILEEYWNDYVRNVHDGDVLLYPTWYNAPKNTLVKGVYIEADYRRKSSVYAGDDPGSLVGAPATASRYAAASRLDAANPEQRKMLVTLLDDPDILVRRQVLATIANGPAVTDPKLLERILFIFKGDNTNPMSGILRPPAGNILGKAGEPGAALLLPLLDDRLYQSQVIVALGKTGTRNSDIIRRLRELAVDDSVSLNIREQAVTAISDLKLSEALPELLALLDIKSRNQERLRGLSVVALGNIGDERAADPLIKHWNTGYSTVVVYWIDRALDDALQSITGEKIFGKKAWEEWGKNRKEK
jgi:hypothetical protein